MLCYFDLSYICDFTAKVTLVQRYKNVEAFPIEIQYIFPIDDLGAVCRYSSYLLYFFFFFFLVKIFLRLHTYTPSSFYRNYPKINLSSFEAEIGGKKIITEVMEKGKALDKYDDAIASGSGAYLLQESMSFTICISVNCPNFFWPF